MALTQMKEGIILKVSSYDESRYPGSNQIPAHISNCLRGISTKAACQNSVQNFAPPPPSTPLMNEFNWQDWSIDHNC